MRRTRFLPLCFSFPSSEPAHLWYTVAMENKNAKKPAYDLGVSTGIDPFMTLSFMALPVIPSLRITTRGVFDVTTQRYV